MEYNPLVKIKQRFKNQKDIGQNLILWVSRQFLRRLVNAEFHVAENESDSAPFSTHRRDAPTLFALLFANRDPSLKSASWHTFCTTKVAQLLFRRDV